MIYGEVTPLHVVSQKLTHEKPRSEQAEVTFEIRALTTLDAQKCAWLLDRLVEYLEANEA